MSLHIKEDYTKFSPKLDAQDKKTSSFATSYDELFDKISSSNKVSTKIEIAKIELEATMNIRLDELKSETVSFFDMKLSDLASNKPSSSYD